MSRNLWLNLKKHVLPIVGGYLTFYSWLNSKRETYRDRYLEVAVKKGMQENKALEQSLQQSERASTELKNNLFATYDRLDTATQEVNNCSDKISNISKHLVEGNLQSNDLSYLQSRLKYFNKMHEAALQKQAEASKELQTISGYNDPEIFKSDFSDLFNNLTDFLKDFLSILSSEQLVILFNIFGYTLLLMILTTITIFLIGDHLINYFELESKYPKLAKYIKIQLTFRKYQLRFYIAYFYFIILILISLNIFMFSYDYFV